MKKIYLLLAFSISLIISNAQNPSKAVAKLIKGGVAFTCITVDSNNIIWAGTNGSGLYKIKNEVPEAIAISSNNFSRVSIKQIAADKGRGIWVAHEGYSSATYGGIDYLDANSPTSRQHYGAVSLISSAIKGFPSRRVQGIAIDKNGKVWSSHSYHDLTVPGGNPSYLVNPGGLGFKTPAMSVFDTIPAGLEPYPAYTRNTPITQSAGTRVCPSVAVDTTHGEVWVGGASYNALPVFQGTRISRFNLSGAFLGTIDETNSPLPLGASGARPIAIHFDRRGSAWVGFNLSKGIAVKNDLLGWQYVGLPSVLPAGTNINQHAIASNAKGEVFIGTTAGLLKYTGGPYTGSSSYVLYTAGLNKLPSNNITGVTIDKSGVIWIATDAGIASLVDANFIAYNLKQPVADGKELKAEKVPVCLATDQLKQVNDSSIVIKVAADSSNSTLIIYTGSGPKSKILQINGATVANAYYTDEYGYLKILVRNDDSLVYMYRHPAYVYNGDNEKYVSYKFVVKDTVNPSLPNAIEGDIRVYHPPVLMIHGVWSYVGSMKILADHLVQSKLYEAWQVKNIFHNIPDHPEAVNSQVTYANWAPDGIDALLKECANNQLSAGKVDLIGHSRGGIFARLYTQSAVGRAYRNDVNKLITLNTPHFGSQTANLILDKRLLLPTVAGIVVPIEVGSVFQRFILEGNNYKDVLSGKDVSYTDDRNGAVELKVGSPAIDGVLNGPTRLQETVPKHAIMTRYKFGVGSRADFLKAVTVNGANAAALYYVPILGRDILRLRIYLLAMGTRCVEGPLDYCLQEMFDGEESDLVVPLSSGKGGLTGNAVSDFTQLYPTINIGHSNKNMGILAPDAISVTEKPEVMARVLSLLKDNPSKAVSDPSNARFTKSHFGNTSLKYSFLPNLLGNPRPADQTAADDSVAFDNSLKNSIHAAGDSVWFQVKGNNLKHIIVSYESPSMNVWSDIRDSTNGTFVFPVPAEAIGKITAVAMGFNDNGLVALDTAIININPAAGVVLDSIRIVDRNSLFEVAKADSIIVEIKGYYSDHIVRDITVNTGVTYTTEEANAAGAVYGIKGVNPGYDRFFVSYQGKADTGFARVTDQSVGVVLPVALSYFSGRFENNSVLLNWVTEQETINAYFDIEASHDGSNFTSIGRQNANGNNSVITRYNFTDYRFFKTGNNYYRLKQVDVDGKFTYSAIVLVKLTAEKKPVIIIYPNPFTSSVTVSLTQNQSSGWQVNVYSTTGQLVLHKELSGGQNQVNLNMAKISAGVYQVVVKDEKGEIIHTGKLMK